MMYVLLLIYSEERLDLQFRGRTDKMSRAEAVSSFFAAQEMWGKDSNEFDSVFQGLKSSVITAQSA